MVAQPATFISFIGFQLLIPSSVAFISIIVTSFFLIILKSGIKIDVSNGFALLSLPIIITATVPGVLIGNPEAIQFVVRAFVCFSVALLVFMVVRRGNYRSLDGFFFGVISAAVINAVFVIVTAIFPDIYELLGIRNFSGFDKHTRMFRSPGLFRGFDTSGYFMIFAFLSVPVVFNPKKYCFLLRTFIFMILIFGVLLSSRSSMLILSLLLFLMPFVYGTALALAHRILFIAVSTCIGIVGVVLVAGLFGTALPQSWTLVLEGILSVSVNEVYGSSQSGYLQHYNFELVSLLPIRTNFTPDNFFFRSAISSGAMSTLAISVHIAHLSIEAIIRHRGLYKRFAFFITMVFLASNFKNNYALFLPFYMVLLVIFAARPRTKNQYQFSNPN